MDILSKDQLLELEDRCIQEKPPAAMAACPLRVDCRSLCMAVKDGNFDVARSIYSKSVPLPHSLSYLCDMPCTSACLRKDLGGAIQMRGLEWAAMQYGKPISRRMLPVRKGGTAAIVGAGPFGLTAASELAKKGLSVTVFEQETNPGGSLRRAKLPQAALEKDLELISKTGVVFCCGEVAEVPAILSGQYDAVLVAAGKALPDADPVTMVTPEEGIFSGGGFTSLVEAIAAGKRAANTIDRYVKHVSITAGREREMDRDTTLFVETSYFDPVEPLAAEFPTKDDAIGEASRCLDCQCMECAKGCAFIAHFKRYPKLYLREIYNNLSIALGNHTSNTMINACALCSQCEVICPNGLDLGAAIQSARDIMVKNKKMPPSAFEFAVDDMRQANSDHSFFFRHQPGSSESRYLFFPGCQLGASAPSVVQKTYEHLCDVLDGGVAFMHGCCGVMAKWAGEATLFEETNRQLKTAWQSLGSPIVITSCPTCRKTLTELFGGDITDVWDVLLETGLPPLQRALPVTIHDACGARYLEGTREAVRELLGQLGCKVHEPFYSGDRTPCCGYGGLVQFSNSEIASEMTEFCIGDIDETRLTYCMGCRDRFSKAGARAIHLLELIFGDGDDNRGAPGYSLRQDNREQLRRDMLTTLWHEKQEALMKLKLTYDDDLADLLEQRLILEDDVREVIEQALETGQFIEEMKSGLCIAHKRIGNVTYWVFFAPEDDGWRVRRAYSHRMEIR